jgi:hypothetical protein
MADDDIPRQPPPIARLPMPEPTEEERRLKVIADAHVFVAQLGQERAAKDQQIEQLQAEVGRLAHQLQGEIRRADLAELELSKALNDIQTKEADFAEKERTLSLLQQVLDKFGTKAPAKPERKSKKKADRESATEAAKADE